MSWEHFVEANYKRIYAFCLQILGNAAEAEDVTQDVFLKCWRNFEAPEALNKAWIYTVARNACIDRRRFFRRLVSLDFGKIAHPTVEPAGTLSSKLRALIAALPQQQREVFVLRHWHEFSTDETAQLLGVSSGTVKTQLKRAVDKIKGELSDA